MKRPSPWPLAGQPRNRRKATRGGTALLSQRFRPSLESLEYRTLPSATVVGTIGTIGTGFDPNKPQSFATIQAAVNAASPGDTITVAPGTYSESVTINKPGLTLEGADFASNPNTGKRGAESIVDGSGNGGQTPFYVTANNVTIEGFTIEGATDPNQLGFGVVLGAGTSGATIRNNIIQNNIAGIALANSSSTDQTVIQDNLIQNNNEPGPSSGIGIYTDQFVAGGDLTNVLIDSNTITGNVTAGLLFGSTANTDSNVTISNNSITTNWYGIYLSNTTSVSITGNLLSGNAGEAVILVGTNSDSNLFLNSISIPAMGNGVIVAPGAYTGTLNASGNWWGTTLGSSPSATTNDQLSQIAALTYGPVRIGSFLDSGSNTATVGFTPATSTEMWVPRTAATTGLAVIDGNIQDGIDTAVPGMTVRVAADTYSGPLTITQPVTILGAQAGQDSLTRFGNFQTTVAGPTADPTVETILTTQSSNPISALVSVLASNVTFDGLVFDGNNQAEDGINNKDAAGNLVPVNQVTIQNSIFQNLNGTAFDVQTLILGVPTLNLSQKELFISPGQNDLDLAGSITGSNLTAQVDYDPNSSGVPGFQTLSLNPFVLLNSYTNQGLSLVTVLVTDGDGNVTTTSFYVSVLSDANEVTSVTTQQVQPDATMTLNPGKNPDTPWVTEVTYTNFGSTPALIQAAYLDNSSSDTETLDIQGKNVNPGDPLKIQITGIGQQPPSSSIYYLDPTTGAKVFLNQLPGNLPPSDPSQEGWTYQDPTSLTDPDTLTIYLSVGNGPGEVNISGTVFVISLSSSTQQNVTLAPALASASNAIDPGLEQTASFISRTQVTVTLTASQDRQVGATASSQSNLVATSRFVTVRRGGPQDEDENQKKDGDTAADPGFWQKFAEEYKGLLESLKAPAKGLGGDAPPPEGAPPAKGQLPQTAPDQPNKVPEEYEEAFLPPLVPPPGDEQGLASSPRASKEIVPAAILQVEPIVVETDLFGEALLVGAVTFPLFALSQETTRKRQPTIALIGLPC